ncbi:hypothetical protein RFI_09198 [Reticulomyxa filosa]|uniref:PHD-type domain-containing protein n=1 Tax=Reticulomyxa filosa TaxID=46433 RepID=X6NPU6_RETFI|nr:hypothetical protein RFI_09198 [Reticulomyxa filosa]|eukprot:ETO27933.1 hypothetical protein RFI_09198 [Reticulomyxa filosa]
MEQHKRMNVELDEIKQCAFCRQTGDSTSEGVYFDEENELIGPIAKHNASKQWVHYKCALWSPRVFVKGNRVLFNVASEVQRARRLSCHVCNRFGASIGCYVRGCPFCFHYPCAKAFHCFMDEEAFAILCPQHHFIYCIQQSISNANGILRTQMLGLRSDVFEICRFEKPCERKRLINLRVKPIDCVQRYQSSAQVWSCFMHKYPQFTINLKLSSMFFHRNKYTQLQSLLVGRSHGRRIPKGIKRLRKRRRDHQATDFEAEDEDAVHERKRRKLFHLEPIKMESLRMHTYTYN